MEDGGYSLRKGTVREIEEVWEHLNWMFVGRNEIVGQGRR